MAIAERRDRAMGSTVHVVIDAPSHAERLADLALERIAILERTWTRFDASSELSRLNAAAGSGPVAVSDDLLALVQAMAQAHALTDGRFDPTVLATMRSLGYDADLAAVLARDALASSTSSAASAVPGFAGVAVTIGTGTVTLPAGTGLDPGAIGKGLAADLVCAELMAAGAQGVLANVGGDLVAHGTVEGGPWAVGIVDDRDGSQACTVVLADDRRAVATSSSLKRRWHGRHHVIDPVTGLPAGSDLEQASVIAPSGWEAEAAATCALLLGAEAGAAWLRERGYGALLIPAPTAHDPHPATIQLTEQEHCHA